MSAGIGCRNLEKIRTTELLNFSFYTAGWDSLGDSGPGADLRCAPARRPPARGLDCTSDGDDESVQWAATAAGGALGARASRGSGASGALSCRPP